MKNAICWFEIPVVDFERAKTFYNTILDIELQEMQMGEERMAIFPSEKDGVGGAIIESKYENYQPSTKGLKIYFEATDDINDSLAKVEKAGGKIHIPKTLISEETGHFGSFIDTEGNLLSFYSSPK
ncbi:MAG: VOC family protein [Chitinophagales bacterium]